jgi:hypothetical protein
MNTKTSADYFDLFQEVPVEGLKKEVIYIFGRHIGILYCFTLHSIESGGF